MDVDHSAGKTTTSNSANDGPLSPALQERPSPSLPSSANEAKAIPISKIFYLGNPAITTPPDCAVKSSDGVLFYLNTNVLTATGALNFPTTPIQEGRHTTPDQIAQVPETSAVLTVILCAVYRIPCDSNNPSIDDIFTAIDRMPLNGLSPKRLIQNEASPLYTLLMTHHAPIRPLAVYAIAAQHGMEALAQAASAHLLSLDPEDIDDASTVRMGSTYFMRLLMLTTNRVKALKRIVRETDPGSHTLEEGSGCTEEKQEEMKTYWLRTVTALTWDVKPDIPPETIQETCRLAAEVLTCGQCKKNWNDCVEEVVAQWVQVKNTI